MKLEIVLLCAAIVSFEHVRGAEEEEECNSNWSYSDTEAWENEYPACGGKKQSPIHLYGLTSIPYVTPNLVFHNYNVRLNGPLTLENSGHTANLPIPATINGVRPYISGGPLQGRYEAVGLHFHWGSPGVKGSEHTIDNRRFDVEMHIVHKNVKYPTVDEAIKYQDGLAVLGIMFKIVQDPDQYYPGLDLIFERLPQVINCGDQANITERLSLGHVLGDLNTKDFFTYTGSLTTPPCAEAVTWIVFRRPLPINLIHIEKFWELLDGQGNPLINNFRPLEPRGNRPVFHRVAGTIIPPWTIL